MSAKTSSCGKDNMYPKVNVAGVCNLLQVGAWLQGEGTATFGSKRCVSR